MSTFGLRFSDELNIEIGEPFESASKSIKAYTEENEKIWIEIKEYKDDPFSAVRMIMKSLGPVADYEEAIFYFMDGILSDISIFGSNLFNTLIINGEEIGVDDACILYSENYIKSTFCKKMNKEVMSNTAQEICDRALKHDCTSSCEFSDTNWRLEFDNGNIIVTVFEDGDKNEIIGYTDDKKPIYGGLDRRYGGMHIACYMEHTPE